MAAIACTKSTMAAFNTVYTLTANASSEDGANVAQAFTYSPTKACNRVLVFVSVANTHGSVTITTAAGDFHMGGVVTLVCPQNVITGFVVEDAKMKTKAGLMTFTATPATGKTLTTNHVCTMYVVELPG